MYLFTEEINLFSHLFCEYYKIIEKFFPPRDHNESNMKITSANCANHYIYRSQTSILAEWLKEKTLQNL